MDAVDPPAGMVLGSGCSPIADLLLGGGDFWSPIMQVIGQGRGAVVGEVTVGARAAGGQRTQQGPSPTGRVGLTLLVGQPRDFGAGEQLGFLTAIPASVWFLRWPSWGAPSTDRSLQGWCLTLV